jgi:ZIP family zinc transporter
LAGISTIVGSLLALVFHKPGQKFLAISLGFSAGVMLLVSFVELLPVGMRVVGYPLAMMAFFTGIIMMYFIDILIPHDYMEEHNLTGHKKLMRTGLFVALGIAIHNFPEGIAVFAGGLQDVRVGLAIAIAIALHNIPEGIAVSVPVYVATRSRRKAFWWSTFSGLAEPIGAIVTALFLLPFLSPVVVGTVLATVAGIMIFIVIDELLPASHACGHEHLSIVGFIIGMLVMSVGLGLLGV